MKSKRVILSSSLIGMIFFLCFFGPLIFNVSPDLQNLEIRNQEPSFQHFFGTDALGRDIFVRVCNGGKTSLFVAFICTLIASMIGCIFGGIAALVDRLEKPMMFFLDTLVSIPDILIILTLSVWIEKRSILTVCFAICLVGWCKMAKLVRDLLKPMRDSGFIIQSKLIGKSNLYTVFAHMLPNISTTIISRAILSFSEFMFYESFVSYLGIGLMPPKTSWGNLISNMQSNFLKYPYQGICCLFLFITLISVNVQGEAISESFFSKKTQIYCKEKSVEKTIIKFENPVDNIDNELVLEDLCVSYDGSDSDILNGVNLHINQGESVGLVGSSGCGKSTLARTLSGTIEYFGGTIVRGNKIHFAGKEIDLRNKESKKKLLGRQGIAIIHQNPIASLDPTMKVGKQLGECVLIGNQVKGKKNFMFAKKLLEDVGVSNPEEVMKCYPHQLSGGIAQRVMIAMALATLPRLLICDEPTASLDVVNQQRIIMLISQISKRHNLSVLFISHDMEVVKKIADRVVRMEKGKVYSVSPDELPEKRLPEKKKYKDYHTQNTVLRVEHLSAGYINKRNTISDISFKLKAGETLGLLGESGSGKTTIVKSLLKEIAVKQIKVFIDDNSSVKTDGIKRIQYINQNPIASFDPTWTVKQSIIEGLEKNDLGDILEIVGLSGEQIERLPSELSIGQCQRAAIARAMVNSPDLLVCDEPTSAMDVDVQKRILDLISSILDRGSMTCLFISHDIDVIRCMADRIVILYGGNVLEVFNSEMLELKIISNLHPYTRRLLGEIEYSCTCEVDSSVNLESACCYYQNCPKRQDICKYSKPRLKKIGNENVEDRHHFVACNAINKGGC